MPTDGYSRLLDSFNTTNPLLLLPTIQEPYRRKKKVPRFNTFRVKHVMCFESNAPKKRNNSKEIMILINQVLSIVKVVSQMIIWVYDRNSSLRSGMGVIIWHLAGTKVSSPGSVTIPVVQAGERKKIRIKYLAERKGRKRTRGGKIPVPGRTYEDHRALIRIQNYFRMKGLDKRRTHPTPG